MKSFRIDNFTKRSFTAFHHVSLKLLTLKIFIQAEAEYQVLMKTIEEERKRAAERMRNLQKEEDRVLAERDNLNQSMAGLEHEKRQLEQLALNLKQRSTELEAMSEVK